MVSPYFESFLPGLIDRPLVPGNEGLSAAFTVSVDEAPGPGWCLVIEDGRLSEVREGDNAVSVVFELNKEIFREVIGGKRSPVEAFLSKDIEIVGDVELGLVLGTVLEKFFELYPYEC